MAGLVIGMLVLTVIVAVMAVMVTHRRHTGGFVRFGLGKGDAGDTNNDQVRVCARVCVRGGGCVCTCACARVFESVWVGGCMSVCM
jgi:hypothetical protein